MGKTIVNKSLSIILLSLTLMGLSPPANAAWPWILLGQWDWFGAVKTGPDPDETPPPFTPDTRWPTADDMKTSDTGDTAHSGHTAKQIDSIFDYLENKYPDYFPSHQTSYYDQSYRVRYYADSGGYLYAHKGKVRFSNKENKLVVKTVDQWLKLLKAEREADTEVVFNWLEKSYPDQFPSHQKTYYKDGKSDEERGRTRHYPDVDVYLTVKNGKVESSSEDYKLEVKTLDEWLKVKKSQRSEEVELVFDWFEENYSQYFPSHQKSYYKDGNITRYYPSKDGYLFMDGIYVAFSEKVAFTSANPLDSWSVYSGVAADLSAKARAIAPKVKKDRLIESDLVFDWMEENYSQYFPSHQQSYNKGGKWTRYYPSKDGYLFIDDIYVDFSTKVAFTSSNPLDSWLQHSGVKAYPGTADNVPPATSHPDYTTKHIDSVFDYLEEKYPDLFPTHQNSYYKDGRRTRYYPIHDGYLFVGGDSNVAISGYINTIETKSLDDWLEESGLEDNPDIKDSIFPVTPLRMAKKSHINLLYDWFEKTYPDYFPSYQTSYKWRDGYWTRYYPSTGSYLSSKNGHVYFSENITEEMGSDSLDYWFEYSGVAKEEEYRLTDLFFNWLEKEYSHYLPSHQESYNDDDGLRTRYYPSDGSYMFVENGEVHLHRYDGREENEVFSLAAWLDHSMIAADEKSGEADRVEAQHLEAERKEAGRPEAERIEAERLEAIRVEAERVEAARIEAERVEAARIEAERVEAERVEAERVEAARIEAERVEAARIEAERVEAERVEAARIEAERVEAERVEAARIEAERVEAARIEAERVEAEKAEAARIDAERQTEHRGYTFSQIELLFDTLEEKHPDYYPSSQESYYEDGYKTRYYPSVDTYIYVKGGRLYVYIPGRHEMEIGLDELFERLGIAED